MYIYIYIKRERERERERDNVEYTDFNNFYIVPIKFTMVCSV